MRIGIVSTWFERGAAYVSRQYSDILKSRHEVYIYARGGEKYALGDSDWDKSYVTWGKKPYINIPTAIEMDDFKGWLEMKKIDVVLFNEQSWWMPIELCNRLGIIAGSYIDYYTEKTIPFFAAYDFLICNTLRHMSAFSWHPGCHYVPWGTDIDLFTPHSLDARRTGYITFFHSAGMNPYRKGCDFVLRSFKHVQGPAQLVIHSQQPLKLFFPNLTELIEELQACGRLELHEYTVSAPGLFHLGDVYVYPTRLEGIGLTIMEALSCGLPVITTNDGPMNEFISHGVNGRLVAVDKLVARWDGYYWPQAFINESDLTEQMQWYVDRIDDIPSFKSIARQTALDKFDWILNSSSLPIWFENLNLLPHDQKDKAITQILDFEEARSKKHCFTRYEIICTRLQNDYPALFRVFSNIKQAMRP